MLKLAQISIQVKRVQLVSPKKKTKKTQPPKTPTLYKILTDALVSTLHHHEMDKSISGSFEQQFKSIA